ncbi:MAG: LON peptidase substrate-binding domain-containing protein [Acidobacteriia bacterium]|jgi:Lon protease-like protein|nr:LON peptidase substrate-binding domain-containing protein [Terriglobia bacterium]
MESPHLPLFPLEVVLFPAMGLPLHIFEPRYKLMIGRCLEQSSDFGVVLARGRRLAAVGCTARIERIVRRHPDGRLDILTVGMERFRILQVFEDEPYLQARPEFFDDEESTPELPGQAELIALYEKSVRLLTGARGEFTPPQPELSVSMQIAAALPLELDFKQKLLESRSEAERQRWLLARLRQWLPELEQIDRTRRKAGSNGRGAALGRPQ